MRDMPAPDLMRGLLAAVSLSWPPLSAQSPIGGQPIPLLSQYGAVATGFISKWKVPGAALAAARDNRLVFAWEYGYAVRAGAQPVQLDSLFRLASISKPFTAAATLKPVTKPFTVLSDLTPRAGATTDSRINGIAVQNPLERKGGWDRSITVETEGLVRECERLPAY